MEKHIVDKDTEHQLGQAVRSLVWYFLFGNKQNILQIPRGLNHVMIMQYVMYFFMEFCIPETKNLTYFDRAYVWDTAVLEYWTYWLKNDQNNHQNINCFVVEKYNPDIDEHNVDSDRTRSLRNVAKNYLSVCPWESASIRKQEERASKENKRLNSREFSYEFLRFISLCETKPSENNTGSLRKLVKLLYGGKEFFQVISNKKTTDDLEQAYTQLDNVLRDISKIENDREFVIACMQIRDFEVYNRCIFMGRLAKYMDEKRMSTQNEIPLPLKTFITCFEFGDNEANKLGGSFVSPFVMYSDTYIQQAYKPIKGVSLEEHSQYITTARYVAARAFHLCLKFFPVKDQPSWEENDFRTVAYFLRNKYNIEELLRPLDLKKSKTSRNVYDYIRFLYHDPQNKARQKGMEFRAQLKEKRENAAVTE